MKSIRTILIGLLTICGIHFSNAQNITITDNASHNADASAMLDVYSTSKGMLVPRMSTMQLGLISNPATGLLVFNTDVNSFFFYNGTMWQNLSDTGTDIWGVNSSTGDIYVNDLQSNIGIGTSTPLSKLAVVASSGTSPETPLFEILDENQRPIFSVTSEGVRIYVKNYSGKAVSGGFAVGQYSSLKDAPDTTLFFVSSDSARIYTKPPVGKAVSGGFAVGQYGSLKGKTDNFMHITEDNYFIGHRAGESITNGLYNIFLGYESGLNAQSANHNLFFGHQSGHLNISGSENVFIGNRAGYTATGGYDNIYIGNLAGELSAGATHSTFIGNEAGKNLNGDDNICIGDRSGYNQYASTHEFFATTIVGIDAGRNVTGDENVVMGIGAGSSWGGSSTGAYNVFIGASSGGGGYLTRLGSNNVCLGYNAGYGATGDNQLFIANNSGSALIYGDFSTKKVTINDVLILNPRSSVPSNPVEGEIFVYSATDHIYCYLNGTWKQLDN